MNIVNLLSRAVMTPRNVLLIGVALCLCGTAAAQGFSAVISPPRFEVKVEPAKTLRQVIEITHVANQRGNYRVYTNDWKMGADGNAIFSDDLAPDSCRPWVSLERRELAIAANGKIRFRFEITPPANTPSQQCRFAIMVEGLEQVIKTEGAISFPVSGRIGVVVYATVGDAAPKLDISAAGAALNNGVMVPQLRVVNTGNAHGRLGGFVVAVDAKGQKIDLSPETLPILPGMTRLISLLPSTADITKLDFPLTVKGDIEWGEKKTVIDMRFDAPPASPADVPKPNAKATSVAPATSTPAPK